MMAFLRSYSLLLWACAAAICIVGAHLPLAGRDLIKLPQEEDAELRARIVLEAQKLLGVPYRYGGFSVSGLDCSGLTRYVYNQVLVAIPVGARQQYKTLSPVDEPSPGDLVFFKIRTRGVDHVGLYIGNGKFIHAPTYGKGVRTEELAAVYWKTRHLGNRTVFARQVDL
jgi:cell wall-associated NlpC family hydrolase